MISILERDFIVKALHQDSLRIDGRPLEKYRVWNIEYLKDRGSLIVSLGHGLKILFCVLGQVTRPNPDRPIEGHLGIYIDSLIELEDDNILVLLQRFMERIFKVNRTLDLESLCIIPGEYCWSIRMEIHLLDFDFGLGDNVWDVSVLGAVLALQDYHRPEVAVLNDNKIQIYSAFERNPVPLTVHYQPISVSMIIYQDDKIIIDPSGIEEQVLLKYSSKSSMVTLVMTRQGDLITMSIKGSSIKRQTIDELVIPTAKEFVIKHSTELLANKRSTTTATTIK